MPFRICMYRQILQYLKLHFNFCQSIILNAQFWETMRLIVYHNCYIIIIEFERLKQPFYI